MQRLGLTTLLVSLVGCSPVPEHLALPGGLPFEVTRPESGSPLTPQEIEDFTRKVTGFWRDVDFFRWCSWHSHGLHASYDAEMPDYKLWWQDTRAIKAGDTVTFEHVGAADNIMIRTPKILSAAISGYLMSGDPVMGDLVEQYSKGIVALFQGMAFAGEDPVVEGITARAIFTHNHSYILDGRKIAIDYDPVRREWQSWNAHTIHNPANPYFGDIWVRNMRSKDDVPHMFRVLPLLMRVIQDAHEERIRAAAQLAHDYLVLFARDIVSQGYLIRTKGSDGVPYVPTEEDNPDVPLDLASFVTYDPLVPNAECNAKLVTALVANDDPSGNDCGDGRNATYDAVAGLVHYFNVHIIRYFHLAALTNALVRRHDDVARRLLDGVITRADEAIDNEEERAEHGEWDADLSSFLIAAAASGMPLTRREARYIHKHLGAAIDHYRAWPHWDLWDPSIPDGTYDYKPDREGDGKAHTRPAELAYLLQYCYSPWHNPAGARLVDCAVVADPSRWGE
jgi:hypothetical protein